MSHAPFAATLLDWYAVHGRDLPWRHTRDPYLVWVSETILQQTRVASGLDYYAAFTRRFPTVEALAKASEDEVMSLWQGLGYYARARHMMEASREIVRLGAFPSSPEALRRLSGVGPYTAAAVSSLAFDRPVAVVDGNVLRVLARHFGLNDPIDTTRGRRLFEALASDCLPAGASARYNQAIMDFGATLCRPKGPDCMACPLAASCVARAEGRVGTYPVKSRSAKVADRRLAYTYVRRAGRVLLRKRQAKDIWRGLYEFLPEGRGILLVRDFLHVLTHRRLHIDFYLLELSAQDPLPPKWDAEGWVWAEESRLACYPLPRALELLTRNISENHNE